MLFLRLKRFSLISNIQNINKKVQKFFQNKSRKPYDTIIIKLDMIVELDYKKNSYIYWDNVTILFYIVGCDREGHIV